MRDPARGCERHAVCYNPAKTMPHNYCQTAGPSRVLLVDDDLFFSARILSVLKHQGYAAQSVRTMELAEARTREGQDLVILNLGSAVLGSLESIRSLRDAGAPRLLAFMSHVKIPSIREQALAAGADRIVPNSAISQRLPEILARLMADEDLPVDML